MSERNLEWHDRGRQDLLGQIEKLEEALQHLMLTREAASAAAELIETRGWQTICKRLADVAASITDKLQQDELSPYRQGKAQGFIRATRIITNFRPLSPEDLAAIENEVTLVSEKLADLRKLLD